MEDKHDYAPTTDDEEPTRKTIGSSSSTPKMEPFSTAFDKDVTQALPMLDGTIKGKAFYMARACFSFEH